MLTAAAPVSSSVVTPVILRPNEPYQVFSGAEILFGEIRCAFSAIEAGDSNLYYDEVGGEQYEYEYEYVYEDDNGGQNEQGWTEAEQLQALEEARREGFLNPFFFFLASLTVR